MNFPLPHMPERTRAPRTHGLTMVMDKGLSLRQAEDLIAVADDRVDFLKLGFGTSLFTPNLKEKVKLYRDAGMDVYCGGTLFEAFLVRDALDDPFTACVSTASMCLCWLDQLTCWMNHLGLIPCFALARWLNYTSVDPEYNICRHLGRLT